MSSYYYCVYGTVKDQHGQIVTGVTVHMKSPDSSGPQYDYEDDVNSQGEYWISVNSSQLNYMFQGNSSNPRLIRFEVVDAAGEVIGSLERWTYWNEIYCCLHLKLHVAIVGDTDDCDDCSDCCCPEDDCDGYAIHGMLLDAEGSPLAQHDVEVYQQGFRTPTFLEKAVTDDYGRYNLPYLEDEECRRGGPNIDIFVGAPDPNNAGDFLARSPLILKPPRHIEVNLRTGLEDADLGSEYERIRWAIIPHMEGIAPEDLGADDIQADDARLLACRSGVDLELVSAFLGAMAGADRWGDLGGSGDRVSAPAVYAWIRALGTQSIQRIARFARVRLIEILREAEAAAQVPGFVQLGVGETPDSVPTKAVVENIARYLEEVVAWPAAIAANTVTGSLLQIAAIPSDTAKIAFLKYSEEYSGGGETFWSDFAGDAASAGIDVDKLRDTLFLSGLTQQNHKLVEHIISDPSKPEAFAANDVDDWVEIFTNHSDINPPDPYPGDTPSERELNYATALTRVFEHAYPTVSILAGLEREAAQREAATSIPWKIADVAPAEIRGYLEDPANPEFDLRQTVAEDYAAPDAMLYDPVKPALKIIQRLLGLLAGFESAAAIAELYDRGVRGSRDVLAFTQDAFISAFSNALGGDEAALATYYRAQVVDASVTHLIVQASSALNLSVTGIGGPRIFDPAYSDHPLAQSGPNLESLFGSLDYCTCQDCRSMLSPAAYLLDLFEFIGETGYEALGKAGTNPRLHRRPDLFELELNCANAFTPMPHIDLVNELLEERVLWASGVWDFSSSDWQTWSKRQTTWTTQQLAAHPEHLISDSYEALRTIDAQDGSTQPYLAALRPWNLPFDLCLAESRLYLDQFGLERGTLVELFSPLDSVASVQEQLEISSAVYNLLISDDMPGLGTPARQSAATMAWLGDEAQANGSSLTALRDVEKFLEATGLELDEAIELLDTYWAGRMETVDARLSLILDSDAAPCSLQGASFDLETGSDTGNWFDRLHRVHRFVRLWRSTDWLADRSFDGLDEVIQKISTAEGEIKVEFDFFKRLADLRALHERFPGVELMEILTWWGDIEARPKKTRLEDGVRVAKSTLYDRMLQDRGDGLPDALFDSFTVEEIPGDEGNFRIGSSATPASINAQRLEVVAGAFGIAVVELSGLVANLRAASLVTEVVDPDDGQTYAALSVRNLSVIFGRVSLARTLGLEVMDLRRLEVLSGAHLSIDGGSGPIQTGDVREFVTAYDKMAELGWDVDTLEFALTGDGRTDEIEAQRENAMLQTTIEIFASKYAVLAAMPAEIDELPSTGSDVDRLTELLQSMVGVELVDVPSVGTAAELLSRIIPAFAESHNPVAIQADVNLLFPNYVFASDEDELELITDVYSHIVADTTSVEDTISKIARLVLGYRRRAASEGIVASVLAAAFGIEEELATALAELTAGNNLVRETLNSDLENTLGITKMEAWLEISDLAVLRSTVALEPGVVVAELLDFTTKLLLLQRAALIYGAHALPAMSARWLVEASPSTSNSYARDIGVLEIETLDAVGGIEYSQFVAFIEFSRIATKIFVHVDRWHDALSLALIGPPGIDNFTLSAIAFGTETDAQKILDAAGTEGLALQSVDVVNLEGIDRLFELLHILEHTGVTAKEAKEWAASTATATRAQSIKAALKAKYSDSAWPNVAGPIRDILREQQRDALLAYVQEYYEYPDSYSLYDWMLIDPEFNSCGISSRIVSASASLQQLVQRWQLGLEAEGNDQVSAESAAKEWEWRGRYRVWEANRKVFLYPENWLNPEWRDDKTPLFKEFEDAVKGAEVTEENVEKALVQYLRGLDEIARLEINGVCFENEQTDGNIEIGPFLHLFARTRGRSGRNYYRRREGKGINGQWTPWEKLPFEIDGKDVFPIVFNRRMMLMWPRLDEQPDPLRNEDLADDEIQEARRHFQVSLVWTEYHHGEWTEPKQTEGFVLAVAPRGSNTFSDTTGNYEDAAEAVREVLADPSSNWLRTNEPEQVYLDSDGESDEGTLRVQVKFFTGITHRHAGEFVFGGCDGSVHVNVIQKLVADGDHVQPNQTTTNRQSFKLESTSLGFENWKLRAIQKTDRRPAEWVFTRQETFNTSTAAFYQDTKYNLLFDPIRGGRPIKPLYASLDEAVSGTSLGYLPLETQAKAGVMARSASRADSPALPVYAQTFYHPYSCLMLGQVERFGADGIFRPELFGAGETIGKLIRQSGSEELFSEELGLRPFGLVAGVKGDYPLADFDFGGGPYAIYNWELFYHVSMMVADQLHKAQRYAEARKWLHHIFDPTQTDVGGSGVDYWRIQPFENKPKSIIELLIEFNDGANNGIQQQLEFSVENPFNPHGLARLRKAPFMIAVVTKYIDNLIAWADKLFRQESIEAVNEATQLYILAAQLLGERPVQLPEKAFTAQSVSDLQSKLRTADTEFGVAVAELENRVLSGGREDKLANAYSTTPRLPRRVDYDDGEGAVEGSTANILGTGAGKAALQRPTLPRPIQFHAVRPGSVGEGDLYFCVPVNDNLLDYWDQVEDRLYKVRNCLNLEGLRRTIRLFEPPIDPGALIDALANGGNLGDVLDDLNAPTPNYRFSAYIQMAKDFASELRGLGSALLSALEKRDAEHISQLRARHEVELLDKVERVLQSRIEEAEHGLQAIREAKVVTEQRRDFYDDRDDRSSRENNHCNLIIASGTFQGVAGALSSAAGIARAVPDFTVGGEGIGGTPVATVTFGGSNVSGLLGGIASGVQAVAGGLSTAAQVVGIEAGYERRDEDWQQQVDQAKLDLKRIDEEIKAAEFRLEVATRELDRHRVQAKQAREIEAFVKGKFTNEELFDWMSTQLSKLYFRVYELAFDVAQRAQRCFQIELAAPDARFVSYGAWENQRKGLLAGDRLMHSLRELEKAYYDRNTREYELTKRVSLAQIDPAGLTVLQETGEVQFDIPEVLFDLDHPSHYLRRIKSISLSLPCVTGSFENVNATLTLTRSTVRPVADAEDLADTEQVLIDDLVGGVRSIATSRGDADSGMFAPNLNDPRYLPFEHKGVISSWKISLPNEYRRFDYTTISDAVMTIQYTAREGGREYGESVTGRIFPKLKMPWPQRLGAAPHSRWPETREQKVHALRLEHDFGHDWHKYQAEVHRAKDVSGSVVNPIRLSLDPAALGFEPLGSDAVSVYFVLAFEEGATLPGNFKVNVLDDGGGNTASVTVAPESDFGGRIMLDSDPASASVPHKLSASGSTWSLSLTDMDGQADHNVAATIEDVMLVVVYEPRQ